jgi:CheY-like chemotaxis protein
MLREFIELHREPILARVRLRALARSPCDTTREPARELDAFLDQLREDLRRASATEASDHRELDASAGRHGLDLFNQGAAPTEVVHAYGDFCQVISGLAAEMGVSIPAGELQTLGLCLDAAIAGALTAHERQGERAIRSGDMQRLRALAEDMQGRLTAIATDLVEREPGTLCVVERDPYVRRLVEKFVGETYVVHCFDDGYAALENVRRSPPSALMTALLIPGMDGFALCRALKGDPATKHVPILVVSMLAADARARQSGADAFLEKPLERTRFVASLSGLTLRRGRRGHPLQEQGAL